MTKRGARRLSRAKLAELVEEATIDSYTESEQVGGLFAMIEEHLELPFETTILGVTVRVERVDLEPSDEIVAICGRGRSRQRIPLLRLPLPLPAPAGAEWIEAYRYWSGES